MSELIKNNRGFRLLEFKDRNDVSCSLQESSLATEACVWLGVDKERMHLNQDMVKFLLPYLFKFVETGYLECDHKDM